MLPMSSSDVKMSSTFTTGMSLANAATASSQPRLVVR
jgi:hypothetical protein